MKTARIWVTRILVIALLTAAVIKSPTAFVAALVGVMLAGYLIFIWLKWKFWRIFSPFAEMGKSISQTTLNLQQSNKPFHNFDKVNADIKTLKQNGFAILETYAAKQLHSTNIVLANNSAEGIHAVIIDMEHLGVITELCSKFEDGKTFTCSNTKMPAFMPRSESHPISRFPDANAQSVLNQFKLLRPTADICKIKDDEVKSHIELLYQELKVYEIETMENISNTESQLLENFIIKSGWSAIEWHRKQNDIVIIHDKIKDYDLISRFENVMDTDDGQYKKLKGRVESIIKNNPPIKAFALLSSEIDTKTKLEKVLELNEPIPAHVYLKASAT